MDIKNPNKCYALFCGFGRSSWEGFHAADGSGYAWLADGVLAVDKVNPTVAARMADPFTHWRAYDAGRQGAMRSQLERLAAAELSPNVREIVVKSLDMAFSMMVSSQ